MGEEVQFMDLNEPKSWVDKMKKLFAMSAK